MSLRSICEYCGSSVNCCTDVEAEDCVNNKIDPAIFEEPQNIPHFRGMGDEEDNWDDQNIPHFRD